jgi:hypothetical protein
VERDTEQPANCSQHGQEVQALLKLFSSHRITWIQEGITQAEADVKKQAHNKLEKESKQLEQASQPANTVRSIDIHSSFTNEIIVQHTNNLSQDQTSISTLSKRKRQRSNSSERQFQGERQRKRSKCRRLSPKIRKELTKRSTLQAAEQRADIDTLRHAKESLLNLGVIPCQIHNLTGTELDPVLTETLSLGIKFIPTPVRTDKVYDDAMNYYIKSTRLKYQFRNSTRIKPKYWKASSYYPSAAVSTALIEHLLKNLKLKLDLAPDTPTTSNISIKSMIGLQKLLAQPDTLVITADKNLGYVVVSIEWYIKECLAHLDKPDSYEDVTTTFMKNDEGASSIEDIYTEITELVNLYQNELDKNEIEFILSRSNWKLMKFYILAKVHKKPYKGRPIVPSMTWVTYNLSSWIADQLNPYLVDHPVVLRDSTALITQLEDPAFLAKCKNLDSIWLASADVEALYPNMDVASVITQLSIFLEEVGYGTQAKRDFLIRAIHLVLTQGFIEFNGKIVRQFNGAAMGSPMIPPIANIFVYMLERDIISSWKDKGLMLYKRFIDDIFIIFSGTKNDLDLMIQELNTMHPKLRLTLEISRRSCVFLDINIRHIKSHNKCFKVSVYQKSLNRYMYLPWKSYHTPAMKQGFIKGESIRYARLSTSREDFDHMINQFTIRLQRRGYPLKFIHEAMNEISWDKRNSYLLQKIKSNETPHIFKVEYNPRVNTKHLRRILNVVSKQFHSLPDLPTSLLRHIKICYKLPKTLHQLILKARKEKGF